MNVARGASVVTPLPLTLVVLTAAIGLGARDAHAKPGASVDAGVFAGLPVALETGELLGPIISGAYELAAGLSFGARIGVGFATESNRTFELRHTETRLLASAAYRLTLGVGEFGATLFGGSVIVWERRARHQVGRLEEIGLGAAESQWTAGPLIGADLSFRLYVLDAWALSVAAGPAYSWVKAQGEVRGRLGWSGTLAVSYDLGVF